jgi:hypothetical protein
MTVARPPRAHFYPLFLLYCPYAASCNVPSGKILENDLAAADAASKGFSPVDAQALANNTLTIAGTPTTANSLGLDIQANDVGYIATIQMGTPPRNFLLLMDSGSADLWVGAEGCQSVNGSGCVSSLNSLSPSQLTHPYCGVGEPCVSRTAVLVFI